MLGAYVYTLCDAFWGSVAGAYVCTLYGVLCQCCSRQTGLVGTSRVYVVAEIKWNVPYLRRNISPNALRCASHSSDEASESSDFGLFSLYLNCAFVLLRRLSSRFTAMSDVPRISTRFQTAPFTRIFPVSVVVEENSHSSLRPTC